MVNLKINNIPVSVPEGTTITIIASGIGAGNYSYLWNDSSNSTTASLTLSVAGTVNLTCEVRGVTAATKNTTTKTNPSGSSHNTSAGDGPQPRTGDYSNMHIWIILMIAAIVGLSGSLYALRRQKQR